MKQIAIAIFFIFALAFTSVTASAQSGRNRANQDANIRLSNSISKA